MLRPNICPNFETQNKAQTAQTVYTNFRQLPIEIKMQTEKKKKGGKKNKLEEIQKPRGYDRELELDKIVGATDCTGDLMFLIKWLDCDEYDLLSATEVREKSPQQVISYYEDRCLLNKAAAKRIACANEYPLENLIVNEPVDAEEESNENLEKEGETETEETVTEETVTEAVDEPVQDVPPAIEEQQHAEQPTELDSTLDATAASDDMTTITDPSLNHSMSIAECETTNASMTDYSGNVVESESEHTPYTSMEVQQDMAQ